MLTFFTFPTGEQAHGSYLVYVTDTVVDPYPASCITTRHRPEEAFVRLMRLAVLDEQPAGFRAVFVVNEIPSACESACGQLIENLGQIDQFAEFEIIRTEATNRIPVDSHGIGGVDDRAFGLITFLKKPSSVPPSTPFRAPTVRICAPFRGGLRYVDQNIFIGLVPSGD